MLRLEEDKIALLLGVGNRLLGALAKISVDEGNEPFDSSRVCYVLFAELFDESFFLKRNTVGSK